MRHSAAAAVETHQHACGLGDNSACGGGYSGKAPNLAATRMKTNNNIDNATRMVNERTTLLNLLYYAKDGIIPQTD